MPNLYQFLLVAALVIITQTASKTLANNCLCDVSTHCDSRCCCDGDCSKQAQLSWSSYGLCANDGAPIPFCQDFYSQPYHVHDLSQGLRLVYTVIQRLFCIARVNFATPTDSFKTTSTDPQLPNIPSSQSALNPTLLSLSSLSYASLPLRASTGQCAQTTAARDMQNVQLERCRVYVSSTTGLTSNNLLNPSAFATANGFDATKLQLYFVTDNSLTSATTVSASTASFVCTLFSGTTYQCVVLKLIRLFFLKGTSTAIDYTSSYLIAGLTYVSAGSYIHLSYSYQFIAQTNSFPLSSSQGYSLGAPLNLLLANTATTTPTYTKIFSPVNLNYRKSDGSCRTASSDTSDPSSLASLQFGVNRVFSCTGSTSLIPTNLQALFNYVGAYGLASTNLNDYVAVSGDTSISSSQNVQLAIYYTAIGTNTNPQYQIVNATIRAAGIPPSNVISLFVQFQNIPTSVTMNVPSPPVVDAYLPNDFLYPFYVA